MRFHVVSLPHTQTTKEYSACAYTQKTRKFCDMMMQRGHEVYLYAGEENEASCTELITCITREEQKNYGFSGPADYLTIDFNAAEPWTYFNQSVVRAMNSRMQPRDFICVITGYPTKPIAEAFPDNLTVEYGVGYSGICHRFRVFESEAWRNYVYGYHRMDGAFYDAVIPNYFEVEDFPFSSLRGDYYLFIGRINANKGLNIAQDVCERLGKRLIVAGPGNFSGYGEYVGTVGPQERGSLMSQAKAVFVPTIYVPPFEGVHIEAMLCGTPVITTDFGVFAETVEPGFNGFRCTNLRDFMNAALKVDDLAENRAAIREQAIDRYSMETVSWQYEAYFKRLSSLYGAGFYEL